MMRAETTQRNRTTSPKKSFLQSVPAEVMLPRLIVALSTLALVILGLVMVYSASSITDYVEQGSATADAVKQVLFAVVGLVCIVLTVRFIRTEQLYGIPGLMFYGLCIVLLVLTAFLGTIGLGAKRWLVIGPVSIQISEFLKIALIIMAARLVQQYQLGEASPLKTAVLVLVTIIAPLGFLYITQSDLGTTLICLVGLIALLIISGVPWRYIALVGGVIVIVGIVATFTTSYRLDRLTSFMDPWADPDDTGYQLVHSFYALASGGLFGSGIGGSYEKLLYLPEAETDFIFAIIGEELGFVGALGVIVLFLLLFYGSCLIARQATSPFAALVVGGLATMLVFQAFLNIACVIGLAPTTGKPLPFISSGGSSLVSSLLLVGIILSISFDSYNENEYRARRDNLRVVSYDRSSLEHESSNMRISAPGAPQQVSVQPSRFAQRVAVRQTDWHFGA